MSTDVAYLSAVDALAAFRNKTLSPIEYLEAILARIDAVETEVGAIAFRFDDESREAARAAEKAYASPSVGPRPLEGIPVAIKDELAVAGKPCTFSSLIYKDYVPDYTAPLAERMFAAGAYMHIRTRTPEFSCAGFTHSKLGGVTHNPWNSAFDVGGSSGGSGAALAAGFTPMASGSDIGGSIRIPASCTGVVGFKPPYGRVPATWPFNLDHYCHEGPLARTVADTALFENTIAGKHPVDITSLPKPADLPLAGSSIAGKRIAVCETLGDYVVDPVMIANLNDVAERLAAEGAHVEHVTLPWIRERIIRAAGIHYGAIFGPSVMSSVAEHRDIMTDYAIAFAEEMVGYMTPGAFLEGLEIEGEVHFALAQLLESFEILLAPTLSCPALEAGRSYLRESTAAEQEATGRTYQIDPLVVNGQELTHWEHLLTIPFNLCSRMPVLNVPSGFSADGIPTGIQIVGRSFEDASVFEIGYAVERVKPWIDKRPNL